jgi:hypothetical protein
LLNNTNIYPAFIFVIFHSCLCNYEKNNYMAQVHEDEVFSILTGKISAAINRTFLRAFAQEGIEITTEQWTIVAQPYFKAYLK